MPSQAEQLEAIGLMAAHETAIGDLYLAYAARFPDSADLFTGLASAERDHARRLADFADRVRTGLAQVSLERFSAQTILNSLDYVKERLAKASLPQMTLVEALSTALDLEEALIERRYLEPMETDSAELRSLLQRLSEETAEHRAQVRQAWETERQRSP